MHVHQVKTGMLWTQLRVPVQQASIALVQQTLRSFATTWSFSSARLDLMELAIEESFNTILQLIHGDINLGGDWAAAGEFEIHICIQNQTLQVRITDDDLPYDFAMLPQFTPSNLGQTDADIRGLSVFILQNIVDKVRVLPPSVHGQSLELEWQLPESDATMTSVTATEQSHGWQREDISLRGLQAADGIYVARLMHQNYGYTYVNSDLYIAEKIGQRSADGRLYSHVAVTPDEELVGHCAIMKTRADADLLELGAAVVAPPYQGLGIFNRLWASLEQQLPQRSEKAVCVHAVSTHPYTQKIVLQHAYVMCALMLAYTPVSMQLKSIHTLQDAQRGSVFYCCKLLQPVAPMAVYLPESESKQLMAVAQQLGLPLLNQADADWVANSAHTELHYHVEASLNIAYLSVGHWCGDSLAEIHSVLRQLCRAHIDAVYALLDLSQADARLFYQDLTALGFISGGLMPYSPYPATLMLQYVNNQFLQEATVFAVGEAAEQIKHLVFAAYHQREGL